MSIGMGLFLSSLVLSIVILYSVTKDRWRWKVGVKRTFFGFLAIILLSAAAWGGLYIWKLLPTTITRQDQYAGVRLGMTPDEVMYVKGYPATVLAEEVEDPVWKGFLINIETKNLEKGKRVTDYRYWAYDNITVVFNKDRKAVVEVKCYSNNKLSRCPSLAGVVDGDSEKEAVRKLGNADAAKIDGVAKTMRYSKFGIELILTKEQVYHLGIFDPSGDR